MGVFGSRQNAGVEEVDIPGSSAYRYPPKSGCYFGSYFIMGGERFDTAQPEAYLFGENTDLNFLGNRPIPFPYPTPQTNEPTKTLKSLINIRKDSLRFVRYGCEEAVILTVDLDSRAESMGKESISSVASSPVKCAKPDQVLGDGVGGGGDVDEGGGGGDGGGDGGGTMVEEEVPVVVVDGSVSSGSRKESRSTSHSSTDKVEGSDGSNRNKYNIEFTFDCDVRVSITIYYFVTEEFVNGSVIHTPRDPTLTSPTYSYEAGANQLFSQPAHAFDPSLYTEEELSYSFDREVIPMVIQCVTDEEEKERDGGSDKQYHITYATVDKFVDGTYQLKPLKQKQVIDGLCYLLQEIYGIENKNLEYAKTSQEEDIEDNGSECVICMSDIRDTLILPCRHLCLCSTCADSLRYQANNCPICRAPFRALLQIRALRKKTSCSAVGVGGDVPAVCASEGEGGAEEAPTICQEHVPPGFEAVSLVEALNGLSPTFNGGNTDKRDSVDKVSLGACSNESVEGGGSSKKQKKKKTSQASDLSEGASPCQGDVVMTMMPRDSGGRGEEDTEPPSNTSSQPDGDALHIMNEMMMKFTECKRPQPPSEGNDASSTSVGIEEASDDFLEDLEADVAGGDGGAALPTYAQATTDKEGQERAEHRESGDSFSSASSSSKLLSVQPASTTGSRVAGGDTVESGEIEGEGDMSG